jgi:hypothetical protein
MGMTAGWEGNPGRSHAAAWLSTLGAEGTPKLRGRIVVQVAREVAARKGAFLRWGIRHANLPGTDRRRGV